MKRIWFSICLVLLWSALIQAQPPAGGSKTPTTNPAQSLISETPIRPAFNTVAAPPPAARRAPTTRSSPGDPKLITNVFADTDLRQALADLAMQAEVTILAEPTVTGSVTADLKNVPLDKALDILLAGTGYSVKKTPDYYLVYSADVKSPSFRLLSETRAVKLSYATGDCILKLLSPTFKDYVQADPAGTVVTVTAPESILNRILSDIAAIDQPAKHVLLDARVVVLEQADLLNLGVQWNFPQISAGAFVNSDTKPKWPWGVQIGYSPDKTFTNSLLLCLNLLSQNNQASIVASPQVMGQDGKEAEMKVQTEEYFQIITPGAYYVQSQLEKISSGTLLKILPRIGSNGQVTLEMMVEVSDVIARGANGLPVVNRRSAHSTVRLNNGGTAAIAGLMDTRTQAVNSKVPGAGDVPLAGELFKNRASNNSSKQLAVFVTATLVDDAESAKTQKPLSRPAYPAVNEEQFKRQLQASLQKLHAQESH